MNEDSGRRISITVAISLAAHAAVGLTVVLSQSFLPRAEHAPQSVELTFEIHTPLEEIVAVDPPAEVPAPELAPGAHSAARTTSRTLAREARTVVTPDSWVIDPEPAEVAPEIPDAPQETEEQRRERLRLLLDPAMAARASFVVDDAGPATVATNGRAARRSAAEIGADLAAGLRREAMERPNRGRPPPVLHARPDGTRVYDGHAFSATIRADGSVEFADRPNPQLDGFSTSGTFDVTDAIMRANGADPYGAERAWFMRSTEALREQLEDAYRAESLEVGKRRLRGRLARLAQDESLSAEQRRRAIFEEWALVDESGADGGARALIEQFVRDNLPVGDPGAFSPADLERLNARRRGTARFAPYR